MANSQLELDTRNESCPMPVMKASKALRKMAEGDILHLIATDPASVADITTLVGSSGDQMIDQKVTGGEYHFYIKKV